MRNDFKMIVFKQLTISIKTQHDNKIKRLKKGRKKQTMHQIMLRDLKFLRY